MENQKKQIPTKEMMKCDCGPNCNCWDSCDCSNNQYTRCGQSICKPRWLFIIRLGIWIIFAIFWYQKLAMWWAEALTQVWSSMANFWITSNYYYWGLLAAWIELLGWIFLAVWILQRIFAVLLWIEMFVAIIFLWKLQWRSMMIIWFPLTMLIVLIWLFLMGSWKYSLSHLIAKKYMNQESKTK